jgi:methylmalonyl-CoA epimerase
MEDDMIQINRIDHIGMAVPDLGRQTELMTGLFGFSPLHTRENTAEKYRALTLEIPGDGRVRWELLEPTDSNSNIQEFIDGPRGPGVHHVTFEVNDAAEVAARLSEAGIETVHRARDGEVAVRPAPDGNGFLFRFAEPSALPSGTPTDQPVRGVNSTSVGIVGLDHLCHAHPDRDALGNWYERILGMRQIWRTSDGEHPDMADLVMETPGNGMYWEVIQPVGEESFLQRFLDRRGPSIHHATFKVSDWDRAVAACQEYGTPLFDENTGMTDGAAWSDAFIHPRNTGGILVQLFWEQKPGVWIRSDKIRPPGWKG